jgi:hypothetical protein
MTVEEFMELALESVSPLELDERDTIRCQLITSMEAKRMAAYVSYLDSAFTAELADYDNAPSVVADRARARADAMIVEWDAVMAAFLRRSRVVHDRFASRTRQARERH